MFDIGREIVTYQFGNLEEVEDKLKYYVKHDGEREKIARAGYERGRKQHTFVARIQQIFERLRQDSQP
jgi:spore maturation protein CgeB